MSSVYEDDDGSTMMEFDARKCILVLGMHRSGTSAVARTIGYLGAHLPKTLWYAAADNPKGFWEPQPLSWVNDRLLQELGSSWEDWRALPIAKFGEEALADWRCEIRDILIAEFGNAPLFVIKEPRICRFPGFFLEILKDLQVAPHIVIPFRNPLEVADSLERRNGFSREKNLLLWLRHVLDAEASTRYLPRAFLSYDRLLTDWRTAMKSVASSADLTWPNAFSDVAADIEDFLTPGLRHHKRDTAKDETASPHPWFEEAYFALLRLERDPQDRRACATMDHIRKVFDTACATIRDEEMPCSEQLVFERATINAPVRSGGDSVPSLASAACKPSSNRTKKPAIATPVSREIAPAAADDDDADALAQTSFPIAVHKAPMILPAGRDTCLLVGYAPDGKPTPALLGLVDRFTAEGVDCYVCLAVNDVNKPIDKSKLKSAAAIFARANGGYDFAAWGSLLASYPILWQSSRLLFVNDSIIPISGLTEVISRLRASTADFVALTESNELNHHTQSFFFAFQNRALTDRAVRQFWKNVGVERDKLEVIHKYELTLFNCVRRIARLKAEVLFSFDMLFPGGNISEPLQCNPSHHLWERLLLSGFPFLKAELLHRNPARVFIGHWEAVLQSLGCDIGAVHAHLAEMNQTRGDPKRSNPSIFKRGVRGLGRLILGPTRTDEIQKWNRRRLEHRKARRIKPDEAAPQSLQA